MRASRSTLESPIESAPMMTTTGAHGPAAGRQAIGATRPRRIAVVVGLLFIAGDIAGVLGGVVTSGLLKDPGYLARIADHQGRVVVGALCILIMASFLAAVPVVMYPIFRQRHEATALGYLIVRGALETVAYIAQASSLLLLVALSRDYVKSGSSDAQFGAIGRLLLKAHESVGDHVLSMVFGFGALMLAYLFYASRLVPRWLSIWGLVGAPLYFAYGLLGLFRVSGGFLMAPLALQELALAVWLIAKGFDSDALRAALVDDVETS